MSEKAKNVLVTGGAGFIGTHVCRELVRAGHRVSVLDIADPKQSVEGVRYMKGDVRNAKTVDELVMGDDGVDACYHFAAIVSVPVCQAEPEESYRTNLQGTIHVLEAIRKLNAKRERGSGSGSSSRGGRAPARIIFAGSSAVYGHNGKEGRAISESDLSADPLSFYAAQKLGSEQAIRIYHQTFGTPGVVFRFFNVYGPGQDPSSPYSGVISIFSKNIPEGKGLSLNGGGSPTRDFVSVHDVARANFLALSLPEQKCDGAAMNLGTGRMVTIRGLAELMIRIFGRPVDLTDTPPRQGDVQHSMAAIARAREVLGWKPRMGLEDGLRELLLGGR